MRRGRSIATKTARSEAAPAKRVFLLSPANASGARARLLLGEKAAFPLALRLRQDGLPLGEVFSFISGLYFRGKLAYAQAFATPPAGAPGVLIITACAGLLPPEQLVTLEDLRTISAGAVEARERRYRIPLERDARILAEQTDANCEVVLLGSIATPKYVEPLLGILGERLRFPAEFAGRGDMSRGGLMLRCVGEGVQLNYVPVLTGERHGPRPAKLPQLARPTSKSQPLSAVKVLPAASATSELPTDSKPSARSKHAAKVADFAHLLRHRLPS